MPKNIERLNFSKILSGLQDIYDEVAPFYDHCGGEEADSYLCSEFLSGMRLIVIKLESILKKQYNLTEDVPVFNYLYNLRDLKKDYSWLLESIDEVEIIEDYDEYTISSYNIDAEDVVVDVQRLIDETIELMNG